jgi:hypothetical protein
MTQPQTTPNPAHYQGMEELKEQFKSLEEEVKMMRESMISKMDFKLASLSNFH